MNTTPLRKQKRAAHYIAKFGRVSVPVYTRTTPSGNIGFLVVNYSTGKRKFVSYANEELAKEAALTLARQLSTGDTEAASMSRDQCSDYVAAMRLLKPLNLELVPAVNTLVEAVKIVGDVHGVIEASKIYVAKHAKRIIARRVSEVVAELLAIKEARGASVRYLQDLKYRLNRFAQDFQCEIGNVTTAQVQGWLDAQKLESQGYKNFRTVLTLLFKFAIARGYASESPIAGIEKVKVRNGACEIFTPEEMARLLAAASADCLPCLAIGAFAGLRSAEVERLEWSDIDLAARHIVIGKDKAKTASRRIVPIHDNLAAWLAPYAGKQGTVWKGTHDAFYDAQQTAARAAGLKWKQNALRHSYASYRFAQVGDAGRLAGEMGNSASVVHKNYRELVKSSDAVKWFAITPQQPANVVNLP